MRKLCSLLAVLALVFTFTALQAEDKKADKEVTLKGKLVCGKCTAKECDKCTNALEVKEGEKNVLYFLDDKGTKEPYHKGICPPGSSKEASVTGVVSTKDGKKWIKPSKVDVK